MYDNGAKKFIAGKVTLGLDLRDLEAARMDAMFAHMQKEADQIAATTGTIFNFHQIVDDQPVLTDPRCAKSSPTPPPSLASPRNPRAVVPPRTPKLSATWLPSA